MGWMNTEESYGRIAKFFHWTIAVLILGLLPVGLMMGGLENSPLKFEIYAMHKSFGLLVFFLGLARLGWRFFSPAPDHLESHAHWEVTLAGAAHFWLYVCMIGIPLTGWLMSSAGQFPIPFFGIQMPAIMGKDEHLAEFFEETHGVLAFTLLFVLGLHAAGALKHHLFDRDETLVRMTFAHKGVLVASFIVVLMGLSYSVSAVSIFSEGKDEGQSETIKVEQEEQSRSQPQLQQQTQTTVPVNMEKLAEHGWAIVEPESKLTFEASLYKTPFTAVFEHFSGQIIFNPEDLSTASADIAIDMSRIISGDADRDKNMQGADWFDVASFPNSRFISRRFEKGEGNSYVAVGDVTIRGVTMPLIIPFTLDITGNKAHMKAQFSLDRGQFGVGQGEWQGEDTVGRTVNVSIDLVAAQ